jgi:undecaprenyl-diphosphatase
LRRVPLAGMVPSPLGRSMSIWFSAFLGFVQGITEFLPISSTAHLRIAPALLGQPDPGAAFTAVIQLGSLVAVVGYFARDLFVTFPKALFRAPRSFEGRMPLYLAAGTIPIVVCGLAFKDFIKGDARSLYVIASALAIVGGLMLLAEKYGKRARDMASITLADALIIGAAQTMALVPGVSRSGATIVAALFLGLRRSDAARFSFLLGVPAIAGAGIYEFRSALVELGDDAWVPLAVGSLTAAIAGYLSIAWLLRYLGSHTLAPFGMYRIALAFLLFGLIIGGAVSAAP